MNKIPKTVKKRWVKPCLTIYGDMATLTRGDCDPKSGCKPKVRGFGDDFATNISTVGGP